MAASVDFGAGVIRVFRTVGSRGLSGFCPSRLRLGVRVVGLAVTA